MSKFTILEHPNGSFTMANSNKTKHWESTRTTDRGALESSIRLRIIRHEMKKVQKLFDEMNDIGISEVENMMFVGHWANQIILDVTDTIGDTRDPSGWLA